MKWPLHWPPLVAALILLLTAVQCTDFTTYHHDQKMPLDRPGEFDQSHVGMSSLTFVFDRTGSMFDDLDQVRRGTEGIFNTVMKQRKRFIYNYVLVMFHDPDVDDPLITTEPHRFHQKLRHVNLSGGQDCPEMTLTGIKKALEASLPGSFVYVFTDARSKDFHLIDTVLNLIQEKQSSVVFVMTGDCGDRDHEGYKVFDRIASASFGQVFHLQKSQVTQILEYVRHSVSQRKVHLLYEVRETGRSNTNEVPVDSHMSELALSLAITPTIDDKLLDLVVIDPQNKEWNMDSFKSENTTVNLSTVKLIRIKEPIPGIWKVKTGSRNRNTLRIFGHGDIDFKYGFTSVQNQNQRIELTQPRPFANQNAFLWVNMTGLDSPGLVERISMVDYQGKEIFGSKAVVARHNPALYVVGPFLPPKKNSFFFVRVEGIDDKDFKFIRIAPVATSAMEPSGPKASMLPITPATLHKAVNLTCNIESSTEFSVHWRHGEQKLTTVPLLFSHSGTSVWPISRVISSSAGRYYCDVTSSIGNHSAHTDLDTFEPPPEIVSLRNATAVLGGPAIMHCQTQTQGSKYTWYRNGFPVPQGHRTYAHTNGSLVIYNTQQTDVGSYTCEVTTRGGKATATIHLSIFEYPTALISPKDIFVVENTYFQLSCAVTGVPRPRILWYHQGIPIDGQRSNIYFIDQNNNLRVYAGSSIKGVFECRAENIAGTNSDFSNVNLAEKPMINIPRDEHLLGVGDNVVLECQVFRGQPAPKIHWERNGQMFTNEGNGTSKYIYQKHGNLHIRGASEIDAGNYTCIAENSAGKDVKTTKVNIGIPPKVITSLPKLEATIYKTATLQCKALGNPVPSIAWFRNGSPITAADNQFTIASDGTLTINTVQYNDSGIYVCRATNSYGTQDRSTQLFVVGLEAPVIGNIPPEMQVLEGDDVRLDCILIMGIPAPERIWFKNNQPIRETMRVYQSLEGDGSLVIKKFSSEDEATYTCQAKNVVSTAEQKTRVLLISRPRIEAGAMKGEFAVIPGSDLVIPCPVTGSPKPFVVWLLNGHLIPVETSKDYEILSDSSLKVSNIGKGHSGIFTCKAVNAAGETSYDTKVHIRTKPTISPSQVSFNGVLGDSIILPCEAEGEPIPEIKWLLNGHPAPGVIDQADGSLAIDNINLQHQGEYKCIVTNEVGSDEIALNLTVHTIPIIEGSGIPSVFTVTINQTAVLPCPARATPPPQRTWLYEADKIDIEPASKDIVELAENGSLILKNIQIEHEGFYTCHVSNLAGEDKVIYSLKVQSPPRIISRLADTVDVVLGVDLELPCRTLGTPKPTVKWTKDGFEVFPSDHVQIDGAGSLKIPKVVLNDEGQYVCTAKNAAGEDFRSTNVVVQQPPIVSTSQPDDYTYIQGEDAILRCDIHASPSPIFRWFKGENEIPRNSERLKIRDDGSLIIFNASKDDNLIYRCRAENTAGSAEIPIRLNVIVPPEITDSDIISLESIKLDDPFSLYCPVVSVPLPHISWRMNEKPIVEDSTNVNLSKDKRRLSVSKSKISDAGIYKCIARNPAGESSKSFEVEILIPPQKNETIYSTKKSAIEHERIELGCPVSGIPTPTITEWYVNLTPMKPGESKNGVTVSPNGEKIIIDDALVSHQGSFTCIAENKAGNLDVDVQLSVMAPPQLGKNESLQKIVDQTTTLQCDVKNDDSKSTIKWLFNGKEELPADVQTSHLSKQLVILKTKVEHSGAFECLVRNSAGESRKRFDLAVWVKPEFSSSNYDSAVTLVAGATHELVCPIKGNPMPKIEWKRNNVAVTEGMKENGQILEIKHSEHGKNRYTCVATNEAGSVFRDFVIETITQPKLAGGLEDGITVDTQAFQGHSTTLECPIASSQSAVEIDWLRNGHLIPSGIDKITISSEGTRLSVNDLQPEDEATYTCVAKNAAGEASRNFKIKVLVPPRVEGASIENVDVIEGDELELQCSFVAEPAPMIHWSKDSNLLTHSVAILNEQRSLYIEKVTPDDGGAYQCKLSNIAGVAEKVFNVKVISKPVLLKSDETTIKEVIVGEMVTLECPIPANSPSNIELSWTKDKIPILHDQENRGISTLSDGRQLHIPKTQTSDGAIYTCIAKNEAGEASKNYQLNILVKPKIISEHGDFKVIENNTLVLSCEVEGSPPPTILWTKDDKPAGNLPNVEILSKGQQFKIVAAQADHSGSYVCTASNKIGKMDISFDVDVIMKPTIAQGVKDVVETVKGEKAYFDCVVTDPNFDGEITWLKNFEPLPTSDSSKFTLMKGNRKLVVNSAQLDDEASYSCRVRNDAGAATISYKLEVLVPPKIIILEKDKNRTVVENGTIGISCPATGKPEPSITWYKDGEQITHENIDRKIKNAQLSGNDLRISRIMLVNGGKFTCEAKNKAGSVDQDVNVEVMTPPKIIRENISSEVEGKLNDHAEIQCFASGRPPPTIIWLKRGRPLENSRDVYLSSNHMRLHFTQLDPKHADKYTCIARNPAGEDKRDFTLTLLETPKIDAANIPREIETNSGRTTTLNCPASGTPEPQVHWIRDGTPLPQDPRFTLLNGGRQLQIRDSRPEDSARFMCIAENRVGSAELSLNLKVLAPPEIKGPESEEVKVLINYPKELRCEVNGSQPISIEWFKGGRSIESDGSNTVYLQPTNMGQRLHILSAQKSDNTRFTCIAKNAAGEAKKNFDLIVQIPPSINDSLSSPLIQSVIPNSDFKIDCKVEANPPPQISWFKDNYPLEMDSSTFLLNENQTLFIRQALDKHGGSYTCQTANEVGSTARKYLINLAAPPVFDQTMENLDYNVGSHVTLKCQTSNDTDKIAKSWLFNGRPVSNGNFSQTVAIDGSKVLINKIRFSDAGEYTCIAQNEAGEARKVFNINVLEKPRFIDKTNTSASIIIGQHFTIDCSVQGTPRPKITWLKDGKVIDDELCTLQRDDCQFVSDNQRLIIDEAGENDAGRYSCVAENMPGRDEKDIVVSLLRPPKMEDERALVEISQGGAQTLKCPIEDRSVHIQWFKDDLPIRAANGIQILNSGRDLYLMNAEPSDAASYSCRARNEAGEDTAYFDVLVLVKPEIMGPSFRTMDSISNQTVPIYCRASGIPFPSIEWFFGDQKIDASSNFEINENGTLLRVKNVQSKDAGRYSCVAKNKVGRAESDVFLEVIEAPQIFDTPHEIKIIEGQDKTIKCNVKGKPKPEISWRRDGEPLEHIGARGSENYIHISRAQLKDAGHYTCYAANRVGEKRHSIHVKILVPPKIADGERILKSVEGNNLTLSCPIVAGTGIPQPEIRWSKNGKPMSEASGQYLSLFGLSVSDATKYTCEAKNEAGTASADYSVDVYVKPRIRIPDSDIRVIEGQRTKLECKVEGNPPPTVQWLRGGRPITDMNNFLLSPRGESMMILKASTNDAGGYSCLAKNIAGESEGIFSVSVLTAPYLEQTVDQNPRIIAKKPVTLNCPVRGNPSPTVTWKLNGTQISIDGTQYYQPAGTNDLSIAEVQAENAGRYTCHAENEVSALDTDYALDVIAPPRFLETGKKVYEVLAGESIVMACPLEASPMPEVNWFRGGNPIYLSENIEISADGQKLTVAKAALEDNGKYVCTAKNEAGTADADVFLKVYVPPTIDGSNLIENPLAVLGKAIYLECPVDGIPQPLIRWLKNGKQLEAGGRYSLQQNNITFGITNVESDDVGKYSCVAENKGGTAEESFNLQVLAPPELTTTETQKLTRREGEEVTLICPVRETHSVDPNEERDVAWTKDGRSLGGTSLSIENGNGNAEQSYHISKDGYRLIISNLKLGDAGEYRCLVTNRAGEVQGKFEVETLSKPTIDSSRNSPEAHVIQGRPFTFHCPVNGYPLPKISWLKDHKIVDLRREPNLRLIDGGQALEILSTEPLHKGLWTCQAENDAGDSEINVRLDVWTPPKASVKAGKEGATRPLGTSVTLHCNTTGNPSPIVTWTFEDRVIIHQPNGTQLSEGNSRLDIPVLKLEDSGNYSCVAKNEVGIDQSHITVDILVPSKIDREGVQLNQRLPTGQTLTLFCDVKGKPQPKLQWFANNTLIVPGKYPNIKIGEDGEYIEISNVTLLDQGIYQCVASNSAGNDTLDYNVDVDQKPSIMNSGTFQVLEGKVAILVCNSTGDPPPKITWLRNGMRLETNVRYKIDKNTLKIIETRSDTDSGIYLCMAQNEAGSVQQAFTLEVLVQPKITSTSPNESIVAVGEPFSLRCGASGHPLPAITWELNGEKIENSLHSEHRIEGDSLYVKELTQKGTATFTCTVHNSAGLDEVEFVVKVIAPPILTKEGLQSLNVTKDDPTVITCDVQVDLSDSEIEWQKDGTPLSRDSNAKINGTTLKIKSTMLNDEGTYTCIANNPAGNATQITKLHVGVPPKINEELGRIVVKKGERAELLCEAVGIPPPQITWLKDNQTLEKNTPTEESKTTAIFDNIQPEQAGVYTCRATNWAGTVYKDVDLVVLIPPEIASEKLNFTTNVRDNIILPCNATGIPEPVVSWIKVPDVDIIGKEDKYQILGSSLAIKNISLEDDGYYHCIAKSEAGQTVATRKVTVTLPFKDPKILWTHCNEKGEPIEDIFKQSRGDLPETENNFDHYGGSPNKMTLNGTDNTLILCLPATSRDSRNMDGVVLVAPQFIEEPTDISARNGDEIRIRCSAIGPPLPEVFFEKDGKIVEGTRSATGVTEIRKTINSSEDFGEYKCIAINSVGESTSAAKVSLDSSPTKAPPKAEHQLTIVNCKKGNKTANEHVVWKIGNELVDHLDDSTHAMNNGSLVLSYFAMEDDLDRVNCLVDGEPGDGFDISYITTNDQVPVVKIKPVKIFSHPSLDVTIDCFLKRGNPLTTKIRWSKDNVNIAGDGDKLRILPNNSLLIKNSLQTDRGNYKCRGWNARGKSWDGVDLYVEDAPNTVNAKISGKLNDESLTFGELMLPANFTPNMKSNDISMTIDNLAGTQTTVTRSIMAVVSMPLAFLGHDASAGAKAVKARPGKFERITNYEFESGEKMKVKQKANGFGNNSMDLDVEFEGEVPTGGNYDTVEFDPLEEEFVEDAPGHVTGNGHSSVRFGQKHKVPFRWRDSINFENNEDNDLIAEGETMKVTSIPEVSPDGEVKIATTVGKLGRCADGFTKIKGRCRDIDECKIDPEICISAGGNNNSVCVNYEGGYECQSPCAAGYKASSSDGTCIDVDECQLGTSDCAIGQECINIEGSFECQETCSSGYQVNNSGICEDIDECVLQPCKSPMKCKNLLGTFACLCPAGFPTINGTCEGLDLDPDRPLKIMDYTTDKHNCPAGYYFEKGKCQDILECEFDAPCAYKCTNIPGSYQCDCPDGYVVGENGICVDIDECGIENACMENELCFNELGGYSCLNKPCPRKFKLNLETLQCVPIKANSTLNPINLHLLPVRHGLPSETPLIRLTAHDHDGRVLRKSSFKIRTEAEFFLRADSGGSATVFNKRKLTTGTRHQISIQSVSVSHDRKIKYKTDFLVFVSVSQYPF